HFRIAQRRTERCKEIKGLRGGLLGTASRGGPTAQGEKGHFPDEILTVSNSERRHFSSWRVQFGVPSFPDCPAPHRKVRVQFGVPSFPDCPAPHRKVRVQFGVPSFPDCPAPHRKVQGNQGFARRRTRYRLAWR